MSTLQELREKAIATPMEITELEKCKILGRPEPEVMIANVLKHSQDRLTPEQLIKKAASDPFSLTMLESRLVQDSFNVFTLEQSTAWASRRFKMSEEERITNRGARRAVMTAEEVKAEFNSLSAISRKIDDGHLKLPAKSNAKREAKRAEVAAAPPSKTLPWVQKIRDADIEWGYACYRSTETRQHGDGELSLWNDFLGFFNRSTQTSLVLMDLGEEVVKTKNLHWVDADYEQGAASKFREDFRRLRTAKNLEPGFLQNTFVFVTPECIEFLLVNPGRSFAPWVWVYDPDYEPNMMPEYQNLQRSSTEDEYQGRMKVAMDSLFTSYYPERSGGRKTMRDLWEEAQKCYGGVWRMLDYFGELNYVQTGEHWYAKLKEMYDTEI